MRRLAALTLGCAAGLLPVMAESQPAPPAVAPATSGEARPAPAGTALLEAAYQDDLAAARRLIQAGAPAGQANRYGATPLALACQNGNPEMVVLLLEAGAEANTTSAGGETVLMTAARTGHLECVNALLGRGAMVDAKERRGQTALMWAAAAGHAPVVETLLMAGADFRTPLKSGFTPLLFAVREGHQDVVRVLRQAGVDINEAARPDKSGGRLLRAGTAALMLAVENAHFELALELVKAGADVNDQRSGFTPLHAVTWARRTQRGDGDDGNPPPAGSGNVTSLEFVRAMVAAGANVNARLEKGSGGGGKLNLKGATPFLLAAETDDLELLKVLHSLGADPSLANADGCPPLLAACGVGVTAPGEEPGSEADALATANWLLDLGADINAVDQRGETAMHGAAYKLSPKLVELLDRRGADIEVWNRKNRSGWTPLLIAQGFRQGNFRPIAEMEEVISRVMRAKGVEPPPAPPRQP